MSLTHKRMEQLRDALREAAQYAPTDELRDAYLDIADLNRVDAAPGRLIRRMINAWHTVEQIADATGCSESTIRRWMQKNNLTIRKVNK